VTIKLPKKAPKRVEGPDTVPKRVRETADRETWEVISINAIWTRLKKNGVSIEFKQTQHSETKAYIYERDIVLVGKLGSQREIIEYMESR
jgi:hypothetical protein